MITLAVNVHEQLALPGPFAVNVHEQLAGSGRRIGNRNAVARRIGNRVDMLAGQQLECTSPDAFSATLRTYAIIGVLYMPLTGC